MSNDIPKIQSQCKKKISHFLHQTRSLKAEMILMFRFQAQKQTKKCFFLFFLSANELFLPFLFYFIYFFFILFHLFHFI